MSSKIIKIIYSSNEPKNPKNAVEKFQMFPEQTRTFKPGVFVLFQVHDMLLKLDSHTQA